MTARTQPKIKRAFRFQPKNEKLKRVINTNNYIIKCAHRKEE